MKYPARSKLIPLAKKKIKDSNYLIKSNGHVVNRKRGANHMDFGTLYEYAKFLYKNNFIVRKGREYTFVERYGLMPYPYIKGMDKRDTL